MIGGGATAGGLMRGGGAGGLTAGGGVTGGLAGGLCPTVGMIRAYVGISVRPSTSASKIPVFLCVVFMRSYLPFG